jgi:hypothetical protein
LQVVTLLFADMLGTKRPKKKGNLYVPVLGLGSSIMELPHSTRQQANNA